MKNHEKNCTANPDRGCGMCKHIGEDPMPMSDLIKSLGIGDAAGMKELRELCCNCPACILATIRQSGIMDTSTREIENEQGSWTSFNYKDEHESFWADMQPDIY
jgi:hypothetical protein